MSHAAFSRRRGSFEKLSYLRVPQGTRSGILGQTRCYTNADTEPRGRHGRGLNLRQIGAIFVFLFRPFLDDVMASGVRGRELTPIEGAFWNRVFRDQRPSRASSEPEAKSVKPQKNRQGRGAEVLADRMNNLGVTGVGRTRLLTVIGVTIGS